MIPSTSTKNLFINEHSFHISYRTLHPILVLYPVTRTWDFCIDSKEGKNYSC